MAQNTNSSSDPYFTGILVGSALSVILGLLVFDNLVLGFLVGLPVGVIGSYLMGKSKRSGAASGS
jgi:ABC-type dipeptide/oligopeptide/nickel transport system permease subunit